MASAPNELYTGMTPSAVSVHLPEGVQPTIPVRIANTKVMVDSQRIIPGERPASRGNRPIGTSKHWRRYLRCYQH
jgi:hypothetical protein